MNKDGELTKDSKETTWLNLRKKVEKLNPTPQKKLVSIQYLKNIQIQVENRFQALILKEVRFLRLLIKINFLSFYITSY